MSSASLLHDIVGTQNTTDVSLRNDIEYSIVPIEAVKLREGDWLATDFRKDYLTKKMVRSYARFEGYTKHKTPKAKIVYLQYDYEGNTPVRPHFEVKAFYDIAKRNENVEFEQYRYKMVWRFKD